MVGISIAPQVLFAQITWISCYPCYLFVHYNLLYQIYMYVVLSTRRVDNTVRLSNPATFPVDYARYIVYASFGKKKRASGRDQGRNVCDVVVRSRQRHGALRPSRRTFWRVQNAVPSVVFPGRWHAYTRLAGSSSDRRWSAGTRTSTWPYMACLARWFLCPVGEERVVFLVVSPPCL